MKKILTVILALVMIGLCLWTCLKGPDTPPVITETPDPTVIINTPVPTFLPTKTVEPTLPPTRTPLPTPILTVEPTVDPTPTLVPTVIPIVKVEKSKAVCLDYVESIWCDSKLSKGAMRLQPKPNLKQQWRLRFWNDGEIDYILWILLH